MPVAAQPLLPESVSGAEVACAPRKRALFIVIADHPGGAERVAATVAAELGARPDWDVELLVASAKRANSFTDRAFPPYVRIRYSPWKNWYLAYLWLPFRLVFRRYDLAFSTFIYVNAMLAVLRRLRMIRIGKLVLRESMSLFDRFSSRKRVFSALYRGYGSEDLLIVQTRYMADHVKPWLPAASVDRLRILPNPVDLAAIESAMSEPLEPELSSRLQGRRNVVFCGRFVGFKRPGLALEAFRLTAEKVRDRLQLVFVGTGPLEAEVRRRAEELGIADSVLFLGERGNPHAVMAACHFGLLTSANEGFPNVVLEMMACGLRGIVITPCAGDLDRLPGVTITSGHQPSDVAAALHEAIGSGVDRSEEYRQTAMSRSPRQYVERMFDLAET